MPKTILRVVAQLALVAPMTIYYPWALIAALAGIVSMLSGEVDKPVKMLIYFLGAIGLTGLFASILLPLRVLRGKRMRIAVSACLACGIVTVVLFLFYPESGGRLVDSFSLWLVYLMGGPIVVAAWNLWRMYGPETSAPVAQSAPA